MWGPPVGPSCVHEARSVGRVPRAAQHAGVGGVERRATIDERQDVVERQVTRWMRRMLGAIARAYVAVLADVTSDHPLGRASPSCIRMDVMVSTDARQARVLAAPTPWSAGDHTADCAELHPRPAGDLAARLTLVTLDCRPLDIAARAWAGSTMRSIRLRCYACGPTGGGSCIRRDALTGRRRGTRASEASAAKGPPFRTGHEWTTTWVWVTVARDNANASEPGRSRAPSCARLRRGLRRQPPQVSRRVRRLRQVGRSSR